MDTRKKGNKIENNIKKHFEEKGYHVMKAPRTQQLVINKEGKKIYVSKQNDFFGCFDLCVKTPHSIIWIQSKSDSGDVSRAKNKIGLLPYTSKESPQIWLKIARRGYIIYEYIVYERIKAFWSKKYIDLKFRECEKFNIN